MRGQAAMPTGFLLVMIALRPISAGSAPSAQCQ